MKLYILLGRIDYETYNQFLGAYSTKELAEAAKAREKRYWDGTSIEEVQLDEDFGDN